MWCSAIAAGLLFGTGIFFWVPYLVDGWKNMNHYCGSCGVLMATWHRSGRTDVFQ